MSRMVFVPRANASFPPVWLSLRWGPESGDPAELLAAAVGAGVPLELSRNAALWRSGLGDETFVVSIGGREAENAADENAAGDLVEASIFQASCSLGHMIDLFALEVRTAWKDEQIRGALAALELARSDGIIRFFGLHCEDASTLLEVWRSHDGFEFVFLPDSQWCPEAVGLCKQRGVAGVSVADYPTKPAGGPAHIQLVSVRKTGEISA